MADKCLICGEFCKYSKNIKSMQCMFCGESFYTNTVCENGHYVCDACHTDRAIETIADLCRKNTRQEVIAIAHELMLNKWVKLHGSEHAFLVAAVLLTAYRNRGYGAATANWDYNKMLQDAKNRAEKIVTNACGYWGCAAEAIGCGIFASLVLKVTPKSDRERGTANLITAKVLEQIALYGGPRCSKRESLIAILTVSRFTEEYWKMPLTDFDGVECLFFGKNKDCIKERCLFFPRDEMF